MVEGGQRGVRVVVHVPGEVLLVHPVHRDQQHVLDAGGLPAADLGRLDRRRRSKRGAADGHRETGGKHRGPLDPSDAHDVPPSRARATSPGARMQWFATQATPR